MAPRGGSWPQTAPMQQGVWLWPSANVGRPCLAQAKLKLPWYLQYVDGKPLSRAGFSPATGQWKRMLKACYFSLLAKGMCITWAAEFIPPTRPPCSGPFCRGSSSLSVLGTWRRRAAWVSTPWGCLLFAKLQGAWLQNLCQLLKQTALRVPLDILDGLEEGITTGSQGTFHRFSQINSKS